MRDTSFSNYLSNTSVRNKINFICIKLAVLVERKTTRSSGDRAWGIELEQLKA